MAEICSIVYRPAEHSGGNRPDCFVRTDLEKAVLVAGHGIVGDHKAGRHPLRQLNLLSYEWLHDRRREGYNDAPGAFGEQLVVRGLDVEQLRPGDCLQLGPLAQIEITQPRTGCRKLQRVLGISPELMWETVGMLARVIVGGPIRVGDTVRWLAPKPEG